MALVYRQDIERGSAWEEAFARHAPGLEVRPWHDRGDPADIEFALVWKPEPGVLRSFPNLRAIFSLGAGVDHLLADPELPRHVPVVRMVEDGLTAGMVEFVVMRVLEHHRFMPTYARQREQHLWREIHQIAASERKVGILGLGELGSACARALLPLGFDLAGWSRTPKTVEGVRSFAGPAALAPFLARTEILVCLLPLTPETEGILNAKLFARLPKGAILISVGRGGHMVEADFLAALDSGQLAEATLDVYAEEPLPPEHPFWDDPRIVMTPHIASMTMPDTAAKSIADNIAQWRRTGRFDYTFDFDLGY